LFFFFLRNLLVLAVLSLSLVCVSYGRPPAELQGKKKKKKKNRGLAAALASSMIPNFE